MDALQDNRLIILTGISGAGKSTALRCFEDLGYCCIDNLPPSHIPTFVQLYRQTPGVSPNIAVVCDIRSGELIAMLGGVIQSLREEQEPLEVVFLDCADDQLVTRYKETRRVPPLGMGIRIEDALRLERERIDTLKEQASHIVDTTDLTPKQLRERLFGLFAEQGGGPQFGLTLLSFGFRFGIPMDADFVFDTRFIPNPYYHEHLRNLTGNDEAVREHVMSFPLAQELQQQILGMLNVALPRYRDVHKYSALIAIGCTGGKHRSVTLVNELAIPLRAAGYRLLTQHRDIERV